MENRPGSLGSWFRLASQARREAPPPPPQQQQPQAAQVVVPGRVAPVRQGSLFSRLQDAPYQTPQPAGAVTRNPSPPVSATAPPPTIVAVQQPPQPPAPSKRVDQVPQQPQKPPQTTQRDSGHNSPTLTPAQLVTPPSTPIKSVIPKEPIFLPLPKLSLMPPKAIDVVDSVGRNEMKLNSNTQAEAQKVFVPNPHADTRNLPPSSPKKEFKRAANTPINGKNAKDMMRVITMSGHNEGAIMDLSAARRHLHRLHQGKSSGSESDDGESKEEEEEEEEKKNKKNWFLAASKKKTPVIPLTNSNVQCVNNSILFNASCIQRDPGVHINFAGRQRPKNSAALATRGSVIQSEHSSNASPTAT